MTTKQNPKLAGTPFWDCIVQTGPWHVMLLTVLLLCVAVGSHTFATTAATVKPTLFKHLNV